jgi:uncharacterized protein
MMARTIMSDGAETTASVLIFFALVFALSIPIWIIGAFTEKLLPLGLPVGALMAFNPLIAVAILTYWRKDFRGVSALLWKSIDPRNIGARWFAIAILVMPAVLVLECGILRATGQHVPDPDFSISAVVLFCVAFFVAAIGEEAGWQGYSAGLLQNKHSALAAATILGLVWAIWHIVPFWQAGRTPLWIWWQCLTMLPARVIIVWLCNNTGRNVFIAVIFHMMMNLSEYLFPRYGSHYDPFMTFVILAFVATIVAFAWGSRTLAEPR